MLRVFAALDWGGPRREWFELICKTLFDTSNQLFTRFSDNNQGLVNLLFLIYWCLLHEEVSTFVPLTGASKRRAASPPTAKNVRICWSDCRKVPV